MYPSSSSSSSQGSMGQSGGLIRYGSAPGSLLTTAVDSVIEATREFSALGSQSQSPLAPRYFSAAADTSAESKDPKDPKGPPPLQKCYGLNDIAVADFSTASNNNNNLKSGGWSSSSSSSSPSLVRHSSSPAGFLNHLTSNADNGFSLTTGIGGYNSKGASESGRGGISRLNSQMSFTRQDSLSQISEESENVVVDNGNRRAAHSYATASFGMGSWDDSNAITFSGSPGKRAKNIDTVESQFQFGLPHTMLEMATMESLQQIPQDSVPCRIRAKRGCATHPRSIAERERRTRISGKLKKLQDLVPNMDKQTSYSDMLDLAVQHIKGLQNHVQKLNHELENCKCGCKQTT